jgi:hypothetical protein
MTSNSESTSLSSAVKGVKQQSSEQLPGEVSRNGSHKGRTYSLVKEKKSLERINGHVISSYWPCPKCGLWHRRIRTAGEPWGVSK